MLAAIAKSGLIESPSTFQLGDFKMTRQTGAIHIPTATLEGFWIRASLAHGNPGDKGSPRLRKRL